jgi:hypothetical protein
MKVSLPQPPESGGGGVVRHEPVVAVVADAGLRPRAGEHEVLDFRGERVAQEKGAHRIDPAPEASTTVSRVSSTT